MSDPTPSFTSQYQIHSVPEVVVVSRVRRRYWLHALLLLGTIFTTLVVGARLQYNFNHNLPAYSTDADLFPVGWVFQHPARLLMGIPFSATLMLILLAHEMGHYIYCLRYRGAMLFYQSGFDESWTKQSVGLVAMGLAIKAAIEEGAREYDLLHGSEEYKFQWAAGTRELGRLEVYPAHWLGSLYHRSVDWKRAARRAVRSIRSRAPITHVQSAP